jgi:hypothetical protein
VGNQRYRRDPQRIRATHGVFGAVSLGAASLIRPNTSGVDSVNTRARTTVTKKNTAPVQGGTATKTQLSRAAREARVVAGLEKMRTEDPVAFRKLLRLLARLVAKNR